ncbi:MAG TPA: hypothetical protein VGG39_37545 [Polyangiaceae bacterium]|jgi:hypothetical protein
MSSAWNTAKELAEKHVSAGGIFVRLQNDGDKIVGVFCGEPHAREVYWDGEKYADSPPEGSAPKPTLRVALNFFVPADGAMKIIEGGTAWFKDLLEVRDKYGLDKWNFEVKRRGKKGDTKTRYTILPDAPVDDPLRTRIAAAGMHDLRSVGDAADDDADDGGDAKLIDIDTAKQLVDRLRPLPREVAHAFLAEMKIEKIRDLPSAELPRAMRFIEGHEKKPADRDPFAV